VICKGLGESVILTTRRRLAIAAAISAGCKILHEFAIEMRRAIAERV
jgi:hypothetical protein